MNYPRPLIAIVGRPNVGKSTLFNRLLGARRTIVFPVRGTTRDWVASSTTWDGRPLTLVDTGGFEFAAAGELPQAVQRQLHRLVQAADAFILVCDANEGLLPADAMVMDRLRITGKPVLVAVNKADHKPVVPPDFFSLSPAQAVAISALHGRIPPRLLDALLAQLGAAEARGGAPVAMPAISLAIVGRPNVGKSSLLNALVREDRVIVSDMPGTTRDAVDTPLTVNGQAVVLVDTAGLRHRRKVHTPLDLFAMARAFDAIDRCDVALVLLDASLGVTDDDRRLVRRVVEVGRGLVLLANKWDLVAQGSERKLQEALQQMLPHAARAPVVAVSARTGFHVKHALLTALQVARRIRQGLTAEECHALVRQAWASHPPPRVRGRPLRLTGASWRAQHPPCLVLTTRPPVRTLPSAYASYLLNRVHRHPKAAGIPMRLVLNPSPEPGR